jgi:putative endopeptidase
MKRFSAALSVLLLSTCAAPPTVAPLPTSPAPGAGEGTAPPVVAPPSQQAQAQRGVYLDDIDRRQDPCNDFYEYANGAWRAAHPIPSWMGRWSRRWEAAEANKEHLKAILDDAAKRTDWAAGSAEQIIGDHYAACMNEERRNERGVAPIGPLLAEIDAMKSARDLSRIFARLHRVDVHEPFEVSSVQDLHQPSQVIANIAARGLGLPDRDYYSKTEPRFAEARDKYREHLTKLYVLAGVPEAKAKAAVGPVFALEKQLADASLDNVALRDPSNIDHKTTPADLKKQAPGVDWQFYFADAKIEWADLNVEEPKFLAEVQRQMQKTPLATWKDYLKLRVISSAADSLSTALAEERFAFEGAYLAGAKEIKPRWKRCAESTDRLFGDALGRKYVERHFPPAAKARMLDMVKNLQAAMKDVIEGLAWMSPETKKRALEKLATFNPKIGYPDKWKDYAKVKVSRDDFWSDVAAGRTFVVEDDRAQIGKPVDRARWGMTPPTSDASYNPLLNEITFPAGILQPPAFSLEAIDAVNYGAIGYVIGHEISHGFDDQGARFDAEGRLRNWWTDADLEQFRARGQCVVDQFEGYFIEPGIHHNGKLVLGEAIGDLAGAKLAWLGFKKSLAGKAPEPPRDGFSLDQQLFIGLGQFRGDSTRPATQRLMVQSDPHPIAKYRVVGPLSNMPAFQTAFACKNDAPMVRPAGTRCEVW